MTAHGLTSRGQSRRARAAQAAAALGILAVLAAATVWWLAAEIDGRRGIPGLDRDGFTAAADLRAAWLTSAVKIATNLGSSVVIGPVLVVGTAWLLRRRRRLASAALGVGAVALFVGVHLLKAGIDRPRPTAPLVHTTLASFPSGHAAYSIGYAAIACVLATGTRRPRALALGALAVILALVVGFTRVYLRAHYVTDVLGGWALGLTCFAAPAAVAMAVSRMRHNARSP